MRTVYIVVRDKYQTLILYKGYSKLTTKLVRAFFRGRIEEKEGVC